MPKTNLSKMTQYLITIHDSNGQQIKDVEFSQPLDSIREIADINIIHSMCGAYIPHYIQHSLDNLDIDDIDYDSVWFCETDKHIQSSYNIKYNDANYIVKFHIV